METEGDRESEAEGTTSRWSDNLNGDESSLMMTEFVAVRESGSEAVQDRLMGSEKSVGRGRDDMMQGMLSCF